MGHRPFQPQPWITVSQGSSSLKSATEAMVLSQARPWDRCWWKASEGNLWVLIHIVLVGSGAALVLYSKEVSEAGPAAAAPPATGVPAEAKP